MNNTPLWALFAIPAVPVLIGFLLTGIKLRKQDVKVEEIHILVNSRLSTALDHLSKALLENIELKEAAGIAVTQAERDAAKPET